MMNPIRQPKGFVNGVDAATGSFLEPAFKSGEAFLGKSGSSEFRLTPEEFARIRHWTEGFHSENPRRLPMYGIDPEDLSQAGWAVLFGPDVSPEEKEALRPLLEQRKSQAGDLFQEIDWDGSDALTFLGERGVAFGPAVPEKLPYYVLLVGDPAVLPFRFQYSMSVQYAVGRLHFDHAEDYAKYAAAQAGVEQIDASGREAVFWGSQSQGDPHEEWMMRGLLEPLYEDLRTWEKSLYLAERSADGRRETLARLLGTAPPAFLFTASHGLFFTRRQDSQIQRDFQGALLCEERQSGRVGKVPREHFFSAREMASEVDLEGLISFQFACYSAGCSERDELERGALGHGKRQAPRAFLSRLSQRLLASGAQAVVGHVDRAWETSFSWSEPDDQPRVLISVLRQLSEGRRLGHAMEWVHQKYAECAAALHPILEANLPSQSELENKLRKVTFDTRNYVVIGDPAVRLVGSAQRRREREREISPERVGAS